MQDFWMLSKKHIDRMVSDKMRKRLSVTCVWLPETPLWIIAYLSELNQSVFKGKVSLGKSLDELTPALLMTAMMDYSYNCEKAKRVLEYEPVWDIDQAIQQSLHEYHDNHYPDKKNE